MSECLGMTRAELQAMAVAHIEAIRQERHAILTGQTIGELADETIDRMLETGMLKECSVHPGRYILPGGTKGLSKKALKEYREKAATVWPDAGDAEVWTKTTIRTFRVKG